MHFSLVICPTCEKTRFNDKLSLRQVLSSNLAKKKKNKNARILSAIVLIRILLKIKECGIRSVICHIIVTVVVTG